MTDDSTGTRRTGSIEPMPQDGCEIAAPWTATVSDIVASLVLVLLWMALFLLDPSALFAAPVPQDDLSMTVVTVEWAP